LLGEAMRIADAAMPAEWVAKGKAAWTEERAGQSNLIREVFGSIGFRPVHYDPSWLTPDAKKLSEVIYDERAFDRLTELADALEEAGCTNVEILNHCRQRGEHVRGCWALDLLLGKE
jgi:hypothetical protein